MRRQYAGGAKATTLASTLGGSTADLTITGTDFSVGSVPKLPILMCSNFIFSPYYLLNISYIS